MIKNIKEDLYRYLKEKYDIDKNQILSMKYTLYSSYLIENTTDLKIEDIISKITINTVFHKRYEIEFDLLTIDEIAYPLNEVLSDDCDIDPD